MRDITETHNRVYLELCIWLYATYYRGADEFSREGYAVRDGKVRSTAYAKSLPIALNGFL